MKNKEYTDDFQASLELIEEEYQFFLMYLDTLNFLQQNSRTIVRTVTRGTLEKKIKAFETLFPMFK